ncbi:Guanine nucleotide-binding protein alpha-4 subunit [Mycena sanguinolenta]|uniref:Guanine nucleotide-binding protein alpha-4 subunit n=1 Tax=Mycena sanguinolenta TaxID=230812 RepID=A0A8H6Z8G9_9AGAR|nr:Guanine nucleotide-binding protein alpha-4 subunit [Mycena sanguinolenta]
MHHLADGSSRLDIYGGTGGNGGSGGMQGGGGGLGLGPSFQFLIQHPPLDSPHQLGANGGPSGPSQAEGTSSQLAALANPAAHPESETYCSQLLRQGRGFPLFVPEPQLNLPTEWRTRGVAIGDVGRITPAGSFDFFFNIYLPADHPINANIPEDFVPLSPYDPIDVIPLDFPPGNYVCGRTVARTEVDDEFQEFPGGRFVFTCQKPTGAVLTLPYGARVEILHNLAAMERYAAEHAESWYKYVNVTRGRGLVNGHLYLITGYEKAPSWGIAYFHDVSLQNEFKLSFGPTVDAANGYKYRWNGSHCHYKQADAPLVNGLLNQTTFIHAFAISVGEGIWENLFGVKVCERLDSSTVQDKSSRSFVPYRSQGSSSWWSIFTRGSAYSGGRQATSSVPKDHTVADAFPILRLTHPSQIIHQRILREARARVVITHDDAWRDVFKEDGTRMSGQTASELQQAIFDRFEILEEDGAAFLRAKLDPTTRNAATVSAEQYPVHHNMDDLWDNLLSEGGEEARRVSKQIDAEIRAERQAKRNKRIVRLLLLGQSESGKSTTLRQFQRIYTPTAFREERIQWRAVIQLNIIRSIHTILDALDYSFASHNAHRQRTPGPSMLALAGPSSPPPMPISTPGPSAYPSGYPFSSVYSPLPYGRDGGGPAPSSRYPSLFSFSTSLSSLTTNGGQGTFSSQTPNGGQANLAWDAHRAVLSPLRHVEALLIERLPSEDEPTRLGSGFVPGAAVPHDSAGVNRWTGGTALGDVVGLREPELPRHDQEQEISLRPGNRWKSGGHAHAKSESPTGSFSLLGILGGRHSAKRDRGHSHSGHEHGEQGEDGVQEMLHACAPAMIALWADSGLTLAHTDDVLRARLKTVGVAEYTFQMEVSTWREEGTEWRIIDIGGSRSQFGEEARSSWLDIIIFLAPIAAFDQVLAEDPTVNRLVLSFSSFLAFTPTVDSPSPYLLFTIPSPSLPPFEDSVLLWKAVCLNKLLAGIDLVLFLNKSDILERKLKAGG